MTEQFIQAAELVGASVTRCDGCAAAAATLARLAGDGAAIVTTLPPHLESTVAGLSRAGLESAASTRLTISHAEAGIAATGSLLLSLPDPAERAATALAEIHAVLLDAATIVPTLAALSPQLATHLGDMHAYLSLTTGPSRTADIERVLTIGVHGAKELHIILLEESRA